MATLRDKIRALEKDEINSALLECNWVMAKAARRLGITERMIGYKIKKYGLRKDGGRWTGLGQSQQSQERDNQI